MLPQSEKGASMVKQSQGLSEKGQISGFKGDFLLLDAQGDVMDHSCMVLRWKTLRKSVTNKV
jgi:hypothetical protein